MSGYVSPKIVTTGLILSYDAANVKSYPGSGTVITDLSSVGIAGSLVNGVSFSSANCGVMTFDGSNDYVSINNSSRQFQWTPSGAGNNTLAFEMWINSSDTSGFYVSKPWNGNGEYNYYMYNTGFQMGTNSGNFALSCSAISTGRWEHVVFIMTPTQAIVYRNGIRNAGPSNHGLTVNAPTYGDSNHTIPLAIMTLYPYGSGWAGNTGFSILGSLGILRVYNRLLSADEILQNYETLKGRFGY